MSPRRIVLAAAVAALWALASTGGPALAHSDRGTTTTTMEGSGSPTMQSGMEGEPNAGAGSAGSGTDAPAPTERDGASLELRAPAQTDLGSTVRLEAVVRTDEGDPIEGASVTFLSTAAFGDEVQGDMVVGTARADKAGVAAVSVQMRRTADVRFAARFDGDRDHVPATGSAKIAVVDTGKVLYQPTVGLRVPWLGPWLLALVVGGLWVLYLVAAGHVFAIARAPRTLALAGPTTTDASRRSFLTGYLVPAGLASVIAPVGAGLAAVVARSPRTHTNLAGHKGLGSYHRTPVSRIGSEVEMQPMPPLLDRPVSFEQDVLPLLKIKAGPHATPPKNSPSPGGIQLDSYEHIMARKGLVVPGKPEESLLVTVLLESAMRMPPVGPRLSREEIQLIATWVAQGAKQV